jgi:hypothetical protein
MKTLFLAWQDVRPDGGARPESRAWFPIGRLDAEPNEELFRFAYTRGVLEAHSKTGFRPLDAFPRFDKVYESAELFSLFKNRLISSKREDYTEYLERLALSPEDADPFDILAISGGGRQTDNLEVFPRIRPRRDGSFVCRFFLHGWRHVNAHSQARLNQIEAGAKLQVSIELNNPAAGTAIQLLTPDDYFMIGWAPRYLVHDMLAAVAAGVEDVQARVVRSNLPPAPHNQRVLIELEGRFPPGYEPMSSEEFLPLHS